MIAVLDDDEIYASTLVRRLQHHQFEAQAFLTIESLLSSSSNFNYLLLDMNLGNGSVLPHLPTLREKYQQAQIWIVTGYASIATTVNAIKQGADDYLTKPLDFNQLIARLQQQPPQTENDFSPLSSAQLEWEHIQRVLLEHDGNISAAARALNMHRRTLQRKLQKKPLW
ncbi:response regulator [Neptunicella marina]|uniref:Response regulator n=1 Tax=Neptunicella marina TaxID=2125989 RepID=A0A8J6LY45_9ALTE|nr:response regulator [Neptunicella marina]